MFTSPPGGSCVNTRSNVLIQPMSNTPTLHLLRYFPVYWTKPFGEQGVEEPSSRVAVNARATATQRDTRGVEAAISASPAAATPYLGFGQLVADVRAQDVPLRHSIEAADSR